MLISCCSNSGQRSTVSHTTSDTNLVFGVCCLINHHKTEEQETLLESIARNMPQKGAQLSQLGN